MTRTKPAQKRSRERVEQILLAAAEMIAKTGNAESLTTTGVSRRTGMSVATVYRYFVDRYEIMVALIDRELAEIDKEVNSRISQLDRVSIDSLMRCLLFTHFEHFQGHRRAIALWFGARGSEAVSIRVKHRHSEMAQWITTGTSAAGMVRDDYPEWGGEALVWVCDRAFEFIFRQERSAEEQNAIMEETIEMLGDQVRKYATNLGIDGVPVEDFIAAAGQFNRDSTTEAD